MGIISWLIVGGLAGWLASLIMKTDDQQGMIANIIIGVIGAVIGGFVFNLIGGDGSVDGINLWSILVATVGAVILIWILKLVRK